MIWSIIISKLKLITVEPILFTYMMLIFMESMALQELVFIKSCISIYHPMNISDCNNKTNYILAYDMATTWSKYYNVCLFFFTFLTTFYVGSWSDQLGRKFPMMIPPIGTTIAAIMNTIFSYYIDLHTAYLFLSAFVSGITFGIVGIISTTFGYISDFTHKQSRTKRIVILEAMIFIGGTVGIYIAGVFNKNSNYDGMLNSFVWLFLFESLSSALVWLYIFIRIPSQVPDIQSLQRTSCFSLFNVKHILDTFKTVFRTREEKKHVKIYLMLTALFFIYFGNVVQVTLGYYFVHNQLDWAFSKYTIFHGMQFAVEGFVLLFCLPLFYNFFNISDHIIGMIGLVSRTVGCIVYGLSTNDVMVYSCIAFYIFSEFPVPALRSMLSKTVNADEKGKIFAFTTILQNLCYLIGSFVLMTIFSESSFLGLSFEIVAVFQIIALLIFIYLYYTKNNLITVYETIDHEDGSASEICSVVSADE